MLLFMSPSFCLRSTRGFRPEGEIPRRHSSSLRVYEGKYLQLKYAVSMPEQISICLNRDRMEPSGNDDVSIVRACKYEIVRMTQNRKSRRDRLGRFCNIYCTVILRYSFALRVISDILWSSCSESFGPKDSR